MIKKMAGMHPTLPQSRHKPMPSPPLRQHTLLQGIGGLLHHAQAPSKTRNLPETAPIYAAAICFFALAAAATALFMPLNTSTVENITAECRTEVIILFHTPLHISFTPPLPPTSEALSPACILSLTVCAGYVSRTAKNLATCAARPRHHTIQFDTSCVHHNHNPTLARTKKTHARRLKRRPAAREVPPAKRDGGRWARNKGGC